MLVSEVIQQVKDYCSGVDAFTGKPIMQATTRDQVTYGSIKQVCTGVVTCIWPTADVIRRAREIGANLIISHEALFWNHGDRRDVLAGNKTFEAKCALLDAWGGVVWRCHDYIHSGVPLAPDGTFVDGIFYGLAWKLGWTNNFKGDDSSHLVFEIPEMSAQELARYLVDKLELNGTRLVGDQDARVRRVQVPMHVLGDAASDTKQITYMDKAGIDCLVTMEFIDFTVSEYIRDAAMLGQGKCAITIGHFNLEEPGMEYMVKWLPDALGQHDIPITFVPMQDTYQYVVRKAL